MSLTFHQKLKALLIEGGVSPTYTAEICVSDEFENIVKFYEYCAYITGDVDTFAQRAYNSIKGLTAEDDIEYLRRING